ncbi:MAG: hypothetical protein GQ562_01380 [Anaerolineales bacterium]|nr:hypothetical protein [Anaerolineales bacterium]
MPKIQTRCPNCQQPLVAEIQQVIDGGRNPKHKELILSGGLNIAQCQACGFQGQLPVPVVYHDAEKEILYTFLPPDVSKTMEEKEGALAPLLKNVIDNLEPKERKGYLFQPKDMLSMNSLIKNILLEDGITEEMIESQQEKVKLLDDLFVQDGEALTETIKSNNERIDREFFALFAEIAQRIIASQDEKAIAKIQLIQEVLMAETDVGKEILKETQEINTASKSLEALGKNLTRSSLLELIISAPTNERVRALTSLVRPAMDYEFFQMFTDKIEKSEEEIRSVLIEKRNLMLKLTQEIDNQLKERMNAAKEIINAIIDGESLEESLIKNIDHIDQLFVQTLSSELEVAIKENHTERKDKLEKLMHKIQELTTPPELKMVDHLLSAADDEGELEKLLEEIKDQISPQLIDYMTSIISNFEEQINAAEDDNKKEMADTLKRLKTVYNAALRKSMKLKLGEE